MNKEKFIGVLLNGGLFDMFIRDIMIDHIKGCADNIRDGGGKVTRTGLGKMLGMDRNRVTRITKALEITNILD